VNLADKLSHWIKKKPQQLAIISAQPEHNLTYAQLGERVASFTSYLQNKGIGPGSKVLILKGMSAELYIALIAIFHVGATAVFIDPGQRFSFIRQCVARIKPDALFASRLLLTASWCLPFRWSIRTGLVANACWQLDSSQVNESVDVGDDHPALITFTSGSTGTPKVIVRSHKLLLQQLDNLTPHLQLNTSDHDLCALPIFVLANLAEGVTSHLPQTSVSKPGQADTAVLSQQISERPINRIGASPALFRSLCQEPTDTVDLKKLYTGGAPVLPTLMTQMQRWAPNAEVVAIYGSSEAEPIARLPLDNINNEDLEAMRSGSGLLVGEPVSQINISVMRNKPNETLLAISDEQWQSRQAAEQEIGEVVVSGEHVLPGYLDGLGDEENKIEYQGIRWHRTGDSGYLDAHGRLWLTGRLSAMINDQLGQVYPFSVEVAAAMIAPTVQLSALTLIEDKRVLFVEDQSPAVCHSLKETLSFAHVSDVISVPKLPVDRRHNAKVDYARLPKLVRKYS